MIVPMMRLMTTDAGLGPRGPILLSPPRQTRSTLLSGLGRKTLEYGVPGRLRSLRKPEIGKSARIDPILGSLHRYYKTIQENINFYEI